MYHVVMVNNLTKKEKVIFKTKYYFLSFINLMFEQLICAGGMTDFYFKIEKAEHVRL